jgi:hypothetical protein
MGVTRVWRWIAERRWLVLSLAGAGGLLAVWPESAVARRARILDGIRMVESGGRAAVPDGDGGLAIGPYQIHRVYWRDAVDFAPELGPASGFDYQDCRERLYAERVVEAYMRRYVPRAWTRGDAEVIARTHNGGPAGARKDATLRYWQRVARQLGE